MTGYQFLAGCCLIVFGLIAMQSQFAAAVYSMSETCQYFSKGYIGDPDSCQGWGYCSGGALIGTGNCPDGYLFDLNSATCNYANVSRCNSKLEATCSVMDSPVYVANPNNCSQACYCNNGKYTCVSCPEYQVFNPTKHACVYSSTYDCPTNSICRLVPNNNFVGDPEKCGNFLHCTDGTGNSTECGEGLKYDALNNTCTNVDVCQNSGAPPSPTTAGPGIDSNLETNTTKCAEFDANSGDKYFEDGETCFGYYSCNSADGPGTWNKCPMGTHFNQTAQQCVTPYTFECTHDRCGNINQTFVSVLGCKNYYYCINQTRQNQDGYSCNKDYPFFDEVQGGCVKEQPNYEICAANPPS